MQEAIVIARLASVYTKLYENVLKKLSGYLHKIEEATRLGKDIPVTWLYESNRMSQILQAIRVEEARIAKVLGKEISSAAIKAISAGTADAGAMLALYNSMGLASISASYLAQLRRENIEAMVGAFDSQRQRIFQALAANQARGLEEALITGLATGRNPLEVVAMVKRQVADIPMAKASLIARTEMLRAYREGSRQMYQRSGVVKYWIWHCAPNGCVVCQALYGQKFPLDEPMNDHPNGRCLAPGTVVSGPRTEGLVSRHYNGDLVTIRTASGQLLSVTPNHPILTDCGWVKANLLDIGANVVSSTGLEGTTTGIDPDEYQMPTLVENVAATLGMVRLGRMPTSPENFHGDGVGSQVHVVWSDRLLADRFNSFLRKPSGKNNFSIRDVGSLLLSSCCSPTKVLKRLFGASSLFLRGLDSFSVLILAVGGCNQAVGGCLIAPRSIGDSQPGLNSPSGNTIDASKFILGLASEIESRDFIHGQGSLGSSSGSSFFPDYLVPSFPVSEQPFSLEEIRKSLLGSVKPGCSTLRAFTGQVRFDRIVEITVRRFSGHVYNLQSSTGWYIANNIITHNCAMIPETDTWEDILGPQGKGIADTTVKLESNEAHFKALGAEKQLAILGKPRYEMWRKGEVSLNDMITSQYDPVWGKQWGLKPLKELRQ